MGMMFYSQADKKPVWAPSTQVGLLFAAQIQVLENMLDIQSGVLDDHPYDPDVRSINPVQISEFVDGALNIFKMTHHTLLWGMISGVLSITLALNFRMNGYWPSGFEDHKELTVVIAQAHEAHNVMPVG